MLWAIQCRPIEQLMEIHLILRRHLTENLDEQNWI